MQEDDSTKEAKQHQLLSEDIDSILARAEVCTVALLLVPKMHVGCLQTWLMFMM